VIESFPILSLITFLPLLGVLFLFLIRGDEETIAHNSKAVAMLTSVFTFFVSLYMFVHFDPTIVGYQFYEFMPWIDDLNIGYRMGVDGISVLFVMLTTFLVPICILVSWHAIKTRVREYMIAFLVLQTMMLGVFCSLDLLLFYIFFEAVLIPMFIIIGVWGGKRRVYASFKFFLYTLLGSVLMLVAILYIYYQFGTTDMQKLNDLQLSLDVQKWLWLAFFASFAVKVPMWPFHTWLPDAHVEAPTAGSVILAGVLLKMGGYGFLRLSLPMFPEASAYFAPFVFLLSMIAVIYTSLIALAQEDMKKLIAYSSVAHMAFVTMGIFTLNQQGIDGAIFQMLSHGIISAALFLCVGIVYEQLHTREIAQYGGLVQNMPKYATFFMIFTMASIGLPGTSGFVGEFLTLLGAYQEETLVAFVAAIGVILGAAYMLYLYRRVVFGEMTNPQIAKMKDIKRVDWFTLLPLAVLTIWFGIYPKPVFDVISPATNHLIKTVHASFDNQDQQMMVPPAVTSPLNSLPLGGE
jgi:NADH-quinone oxidoreductase subunit M